MAVLGGPPAFSETLRVGRPNVGERERLCGRLEALLDRRWLTSNGPFVQEFETRLAEFLGVRQLQRLFGSGRPVPAFPGSTEHADR